MRTSSKQNKPTNDSREIAAFVSKGLSPEQVAAKVDLPIGYVRNITESPQFIKDLQKVGGDEAVQRWNEYNDSRAANTSLRKRVVSKLDIYISELETLAEGKDTKPELRFNVIKFLIERARIGDEAPQPELTELPASFFSSLVAATKEMDEWEAKKV